MFSAPHMYVYCLQALDICEGNDVLDIGSGCGHMTALSGFLAGPVFFVLIVSNGSLDQL